MSEKPSTKKDEKPATPEVMMKVRVIKDGTIIDGAKCAKTLITSTAKSKAEALHEQGLVQIIGVA